MNIDELLHFSRRWWWLLVVVTLAAGTASYVVSSRMPRVYQARAMLLITAGQPSADTGVNAAGLDAATQLTRTYSTVLTTRPVIEAAVQASGRSMGYAEAAGMVDATPVSNTQLIQLSVRSTDPQFAAEFANDVGAAFIQQINASQTSRFSTIETTLTRQVDQLAENQHQVAQRADDVRARSTDPANDNEVARAQVDLQQAQQAYAAAQRSLQDLQLEKARSTTPIAMADPAVPSDQPVQPQVRMNVASAAGVGLLLALLVAYLIERVDDRLLSAQRLERFAGVQAIGVVPRVSNRQRHAPGHARIADLGDEVQLAVQLLWGNVDVGAAGDQPSTLLVTGVGPGDGATTIAVYLAMAAARAGRRVVLSAAELDSDPMRHVLGMDLSVAADVGPRARPSRPLEIVQHRLIDTPVPRLHVLRGSLEEHETAADALEYMSTLLADVRDQADLVIIDTPLASGALKLSARGDAVVLVVDAVRRRVRDVVAAEALLRSAGANVAGVVLNKVHGSPLLIPYVPRSPAAAQRRNGVAQGASHIGDMAGTPHA